VELTDQETVVLAEWETRAEKVREAPARMLADVGVTEMATESPEGGGGFEVVLEEALLQASRDDNTKNVNREKEIRRKKEDIIRNSFGRGGGDRQLDGGPELGQGKCVKRRFENGNWFRSLELACFL